VKGSGAPRRAETLGLRGLEPAPAQTWGAIRLVPLIRREVRGDLRLARRRYGEDLAITELGGRPGGPGLAYASFVPHALVVSWNEDGTPVASLGASLQKGAKDGVSFGGQVRVLHRMVKREDGLRLRLLPLHLAMEGFLALHFRMPVIAWPGYSKRALRSGLSPRVETSWSGAAITGLGEALRVFEIHEGQSGVMVFTADALAAVFVVPHPDDYRALHASLLEDFFGELLYRYGLLYPDVPPVRTTIAEAGVCSLADLRAALDGIRSEWSDFAALLAAGLLEREALVETVYTLAPFCLDRFVTRLALHEENHIGERIVRADGTVEYMKTFRLSDAQARRAHLLSTLDAAEWNLDAAAASLRASREELTRRIENAGFGYLLAPGVLAAAR
jgi:hypothetical protein